MKKFLILASGLVLAACGGSGGGDVGRPTVPQRPPNQNLPVHGDPVVENKDVTTVLPELTVGDVDYNLENTSFNTSGADGDVINLTFDVDADGIITGVAITDPENGYVKATRQKKTNVFVASNGDEYTYNSLAGDVKLQYSDFGNIVEKAYNDVAVTHNFAGGYKVASVKKPETEMKFSGIAVGTVADDVDSLDLRGNATLSLADGAETLNMDFTQNGWYNVTVAGNNITFAGDGVENLAVVGGDGAFTDENGKMNIGYYGNNGVASEFVGTVWYRENNTILDVAVGGVADK